MDIISFAQSFHPKEHRCYRILQATLGQDSDLLELPGFRFQHIDEHREEPLPGNVLDSEEIPGFCRETPATVVREFHSILLVLLYN